MDIQLRQLRALLAVVEEGTFTDAAVALDVSQAAVSRAIAALEQALGTRLVQRTTRQVALTATGTRVAAGARRVLDEVDRLYQTVERSRTELRVGYAWAALGRHTRHVQRAWAAAHPRTPLVFVHVNSPSAGLREGLADVAVVRRPLTDDRFAATQVGTEPRYAAVATDNPLARRRSVRLAELARYPVAIDARTGTTSPQLWRSTPPPQVIRRTHGVDEWLILIAAGQAVGITSQATANQNPRPGVAYRPVRDAPPIPVWLAWSRDDPPAHLKELVDLVSDSYKTARAGAA